MTDLAQIPEPPDEPEETPHEMAHRLVGKSLGNLAYDLRTLEKRLKQPYARTLSESDRDDVRTFLSSRFELIEGLLAGPASAPAFEWSDENGGEQS